MRKVINADDLVSNAFIAEVLFGSMLNLVQPSPNKSTI